MIQRTAHATAREHVTGPRSTATEVEPSDGMLDDLEAPAGDAPYGLRQIGGGSRYEEYAVPASSPRGPGAPSDPDAMDGLIELAGMLDPEEWLDRLTAQDG